jgi:hypothetical protein
MHASGPPQEIRNWLFRYTTKEIERPESVRSIVYLWEESKHKRQ